MTKVSHDDAAREWLDRDRVTDVDAAHSAALVDHEHREVLLRKLADLKREVDEAKFGAAAYDEPEGDESDPGFLMPAPGCGHPMPQGADCCISTGPSVSVHHDGPGRDQHGEHDRRVTFDEVLLRAAEETLQTRIRRIIRTRDVGQYSAEQATENILIAVSAELRYTAPLTLPAECVDVPNEGPKWQILDARDERGWHDVVEVVECADPGCTVLAGRGNRDEVCVVLVGSAWADGFAHYPSFATVDVRIPARIEVTR